METTLRSVGNTGMIRPKHPGRLPRSLPCTLLILVLVGCGARGDNINLLTPDDLYAQGAEQFEAGNYERAIVLLERFTSSFLGDPRVPEARMLLGDAHMARREYPTAAAHYQRLISDFPSHPRGREARYRICEAYVHLSPPPQLDQEYTIQALLHCESVAEYYPGTEEGEQALAHVEALRHKLAKKALDAGMHYFRRRAYDAAVVYFEDVVAQFPDTPLAPEALERLVETYGRMGYVEDAEEAQERLLRDYPQSPEAQAMQD
jgi:outer membrane protein assembly factor BamD